MTLPVVPMARGRCSERGLTLIELLLSILILGGMAVVFSVLLSSSLDLWEAGTSGSRVDGEVRSVIERMGREIRASRGSAGQVVIGAGNTSVTFPLDTDDDGTYETTVSYYLDGTVLRRQDNGLPATGNPMLSDVGALVFNDPFGNSDLITVSVTVSKTLEGKKGIGSVTMRTGVGPRND